MILFVKSNLEPIYENWVWSDKETKYPFSFRGIEKTTDLFGNDVQEEKKLKFKFIKSTTGLLIDFEDCKDSYQEYALYLGNKTYVGFKIVKRFFNVKNIVENYCDYFVLKYSVDNHYLKYHGKGFYNNTFDMVNLGVTDMNNSILGMPFKTNLSKTKKMRYFYSLLNNDNKKELINYPMFDGSNLDNANESKVIYQLTNAIKNKNDYKEILFSRPVLLSYIAVNVIKVDMTDSDFKNKKYKIKLL